MLEEDDSGDEPVAFGIDRIWLARTRYASIWKQAEKRLRDDRDVFYQWAEAMLQRPEWDSVMEHASALCSSVVTLSWSWDSSLDVDVLKLTEMAHRVIRHFIRTPAFLRDRDPVSIQFSLDPVNAAMGRRLTLRVGVAQASRWGRRDDTDRTLSYASLYKTHKHILGLAMGECLPSPLLCLVSEYTDVPDICSVPQGMSLPLSIACYSPYYTNG